MESVSGNGFKPGQYNCRVESVQALEANSGSPYLLFDLIVTEGEFAGKRIPYEAYATDGRKPYFAKELAAVGFDVKGGAWDDLATTVVGKECTVTLKAKEFNHQTTLRAENMKPRSAINQPGGVLGRIASLYGGKVAAAEGPKHPDVPF